MVLALPWGNPTVILLALSLADPLPGKPSPSALQVTPADSTAKETTQGSSSWGQGLEGWPRAANSRVQIARPELWTPVSSCPLCSSCWVSVTKQVLSSGTPHQAPFQLRCRPKTQGPSFPVRPQTQCFEGPAAPLTLPSESCLFPASLLSLPPPGHIC